MTELPTVVRGLLKLGAVVSSQSAGRGAELLDISGRKVMGLRPGGNDVHGLAPGIYFVRERFAASGERSAVRKVIIAR